MIKKTALLVVIAVGALHAFAATQTDVYIGITSKGNKQVPTIGMPNFIAENALTPEAQQVQDVLRSDLLFARYFDVNDSGPAVDEKHISASLNQWAPLHVSYVLVGLLRKQEEYYVLSVDVYDMTSAGRPRVYHNAWKGSAKSLRRLAHIASDKVIMALTGKRGIADTRIAFANNSTKHKEIYAIDYDGANLQRLTKDNSISILPRWSKDGRIFYTTYRYRNPDIFAIDLRKGKISPIIIKGGLSLIGGMSPDGKALAFTSSSGANPSIFVYNLETHKKQQLTSQVGVDGSPSYSPDGKYITFVSNRSGNPQIYVLELATRQIRRLTKNFNWSDSPQWSPTGEWIVFSGREAPYHPMDIFLVDLTGTQIRRLTTDAGSNEDPTWSPDGRFIAFTTTRNGQRQLFVMDGDGSAPHLLADIKGDTFTPHWSF